MGIVSGIFLLLIIVVVFAYGGSVIMGFVTDTSGIVAQKIRDTETQIPSAPAGSKACDLFLTATWREKTTNEVFEVEQILFTNTDGKTVKKEVSNCGTVSVAPNSLLTLLDFMGTNKDVKPLDIIVPQQSVFEEPYTISFVLINSDGYEKKLPHYQSIKYVVPKLTYEFDFEQKLIFRDVEYGEYTLELRPDGARWFDHGESQPYMQHISVP